MIATPLAVPETERIAALLAELTGRAPPRPRLTPPIESDGATAVEITIPARRPPPKAPETVKQLLEAGNWRNQTSSEPEASAASVRDQAGPSLTLPARMDEPLPAPFGVLTVGKLFGLVNWRNRPDEARPLPLIKPPPPPGSEFTVEAMISTFGWE